MDKISITIGALLLFYMISCKNNNHSIVDNSPATAEISDEPIIQLTAGLEFKYLYVEYDSLGRIDTTSKPFSNVFYSSKILRDTIVNNEKWYIIIDGYDEHYVSIFAMTTRNDGIWNAYFLRNKSTGVSTVLTGYQCKFPSIAGEEYDMFNGYAIGGQNNIIGPLVIGKKVVEKNIYYSTPAGRLKCYVAEYKFGGSEVREISSPAIGMLKSEAYGYTPGGKKYLNYTSELVQVKR